MREIHRVKDFDAESFPCLECGKPVRLYFNGGELDRETCCGLTYQTEHGPIDLVVYDPEGRAEQEGGE